MGGKYENRLFLSSVSLLFWFDGGRIGTNFDFLNETYLLITPKEQRGHQNARMACYFHLKKKERKEKRDWLFISQN